MDGRAALERSVEQLHAQSAPTEVGAADVEAHERERVVVAHHRHTHRQLAVDLEPEEPVGIGGEERVGVVQAGVPTLGGRPVEHGREVGAVEPAHPRVVGHRSSMERVADLPAFVHTRVDDIGVGKRA